VALVGGALAPQARAQAPAAAPAASDAGAPDFLRTLPRPPDAPASLLAPPVPPGPEAPPLFGPYFEPHPLLDPPTWPAPGWLATAEVAAIHPHLQTQLRNTVQVGPVNGISPPPANPPTRFGPDTVALPGAPLDWTAEPRVEVGYRLPAGFGEIALAYRFLV